LIGVSMLEAGRRGVIGCGEARRGEDEIGVGWREEGGGIDG
jgi:hypothetical protein